LSGEEVTVFLMTLMILAGVAVLWMAMQSRRRIREMEHRERLAMIEKGLIPPPELDPGLFERRSGLAPRLESQSAARSRSFGVIMIGLGLGLMLLISFASGEPDMGFGLGGAVMVLGAAFYVNSLLSARQEIYRAHPEGKSASAVDRPSPPSNLAP
jgi:hypothetical protein